MHDVLVKLDCLGHDDPTMMQMLAGSDGHRRRKHVPLDDPEVMKPVLRRPRRWA